MDQMVHRLPIWSIFGMPMKELLRVTHPMAILKFIKPLTVVQTGLV
jgi:hypothetical protein